MAFRVDLVVRNPKGDSDRLRDLNATAGLNDGR
jgi:hypothetical protein